MIKARSVPCRLSCLSLLALLGLWAMFVAPARAQEPGKPGKQPPALREVQTTLENAANAKNILDFLGVRLTDDQKAYLNANRFLLIPLSDLKKSLPPPPCAEPWDDMLTMSDAVGGEPDEHLRKPENARLITPDAVLHAYHRLFDNTLDHLETTVLARELYFFILAMNDAIREEKRTASPELAARLERVSAQLTVPLILLTSAPWGSEPGAKEPPGNDPAALEADKTAALSRLEALAGEFTPGTIETVKAELENIFAAKSVAVSPLFAVYASAPDDKGLGGFTAEMDYTQFTPRGHYAKNGRTRAYFRAMAYLGKAQWPLEKDPGLGDALILTLLMDRKGPGGRPALEAWNRLYEVTTLFAGKPDDPGREEISHWIAWTFGDRRLTPADAVDPAVQAELSARRERTSGPRIRGLSGQSGLRLLGQRFTRDGWILSKLFGERPWASPSALYVAAAFGDRAAKEFALEHLKRNTPPGKGPDAASLASDLDTVTVAVNSWPASLWQESVASAWLAALKGLCAPRGPGHPAYMRSPAFAAKNVQTILGSFAELKHDTILYAKQPEAECGEGSDTPPPPVPKGFVETGEAFWQAMVELAAKTSQGFNLPKWRSFEGDVRFLAEVARKESAGLPVSKQEYERLRTLRLDAYAQPLEPGLVPTEDDGRTALVADVFTNRAGNSILYEATGPHSLMLALVGNENSPRLVAGVAYDHFEFTGPLDRRMTDQEWRATVYKGQGKLPPKNFWYKALVPGGK